MKKIVTIITMLMLVSSMTGCQKENMISDEKTTVEGMKETAKETAKEETKEMETEEIAKEEVISEENLFPEFIIEETDTTVTYMNTFGEATTVTKNPKKVVVVYNSILGLWYYAGGEAMTKAGGTINVPEAALDNIDMGKTSELSVEAVVALEPDLVILASNVNSQVELAPVLKEMGIETMLINTSDGAFLRFQENAYLFSKINESEEAYKAKIEPILASINKTVAEAKETTTSPKVAIMFASKKSIRLESEAALTGEIVEILGGKNILQQEDIAAEGETRVAFSIETLVASNPEVIMIATMGNIEACKENVEAMIAENPVWNEVDAVKNKRVHYLPKQFSVYKPNEVYAEAFLHNAKLLYPEIFGE